MPRLLGLFSILLTALLMGCASPTTAKPPIPVSDSQTQIPMPIGQELPITAKAVIANGVQINLEVAQTPEQQQMGLMYRPALPDHRGMLFLFSAPQPVSFWMKNVPVSLDMVFLNRGVVKYIQAAAPSCTSEPCATYGPNTPIDMVIELRSGHAAELGLKVGSTIKISPLDSGTLGN